MNDLAFFAKPLQSTHLKSFELSKPLNPLSNKKLSLLKQRNLLKLKIKFAILIEPKH